MCQVTNFDSHQGLTTSQLWGQLTNDLLHYELPQDKALNYFFQAKSKFLQDSDSKQAEHCTGSAEKNCAGALWGQVKRH